MIKEYYAIAPLIVKNIDSRNDNSIIYQYIWDEYLHNCLKNIEQGEYEQCKERYCKMVCNLRNKYLEGDLVNI